MNLDSFGMTDVVGAEKGLESDDIALSRRYKNQKGCRA